MSCSFPRRLAIVLALLPVLGGTAAAATLSLEDDGVHVDAGSMGAMVLSYPVLAPEQSGAPDRAPVGKSLAGGAAVLQYEGGATVRVQAADSGEITYAFSGIAGGVKSWQATAIIEFSYQQGGKWKIGATEGTFPVEKPAKPQIFQGNAADFVLTNAEGKSLAFHVPQYAYQELTDNRAWNWGVYAWHLHVPYDPSSPTAKIIVAAGASLDAKAAPLVDPFGQIQAGEWPGKVHAEDELRADARDEAAYYDALPFPALDAYGGLPGSREKLGLGATGFFHIEKKGKNAILADPDGNAFFHLGVCAFAPGDDYTLVEGREASYAWLPPRDGPFRTAYKDDSNGTVLSFYLANAIRKYGTPYALDAFQARMIPRVRRFGFNSIGAFSPYSPAARAAGMPYVSHLPLDAWGDKIKYIPGIVGTWDPFDAANRAQVEANFAGRIAAQRDDPLLIGYFLANEPIYEDIPKVVPGLKGSAWACKHALAAMLAAKYKDAAAFNAAWGLSLPSLAALDDTPLPVATPAAAEDLHAFSGLFYEAYFKLVAGTFRKYDPHHLLLGCRFQPGTINDEQLCRIAGKYLDVMSYNYYTNAVDKEFLGRVHAWTGGLPLMLSEFYWTAPRESGLVGGQEVATQRQRGLAYRNYVEQAASLGYVVGIEWFTLLDQASTGRWFSRYNGERANTGLFSVADRPYKEMLAGMKQANEGVYGVWLDGRAPFVFDDPRFAPAGDARQATAIPRALGPIALDGTTRNWPGIPPNVVSGQRLVLGSEAGGLEATFKLCWDDAHLYVLASVVDPTPLRNKHAGADLWQGDAVEIFLGTENVGEGGPLRFSDRHLLIGAGAAGKAPVYDSHAPAQYDCPALVVPGGDGKSYTLEAAIPWESLGLVPKVGAALRFDFGVDDSAGGEGRRAQIMWNGTDKNAGDRTRWGGATLQP